LLAGEVHDEQGGALLKIVRTDGTEAFSQKIENEGELAVSPDGQHFGFVYISRSAFNQWLDKAIDMQFWPDMVELALWRVSHPALVAKIALGRNVTNYCFSPSGSFAYTDGGRLRVIPLPFQP
jgi:hypothetical protein